MYCFDTLSVLKSEITHHRWVKVAHHFLLCSYPCIYILAGSCSYTTVVARHIGQYCLVSRTNDVCIMHTGQFNLQLSSEFKVELLTIYFNVLRD